MPTRRIAAAGLMAGFGALALGPARAQTLAVDNPRQRAVAALMPRIGRAPWIERPPRIGGTGTVFYMFTNANCPRCQAFERAYPQGFRYAAIRYIVWPWSGEDPRLLNVLYRERRLDRFDLYMRRALTPSAHPLPDRTAEMKRLGTVVGDALITNGFGTPYFVIEVPDPQKNEAIYIAGSIADEDVRTMIGASL